MLRMNPLPWLLLGACALMGCESHPAQLEIKGPRDAVESTQKNPVFPTFDEKDGTLQLRASAFDDKGRYMGAVPVKWDSSNRKAFTVSQTGLLTVLGSGEAKITATYAKGDVKRTASKDVKAVIVDEIAIVKPVLEEGKKVLEMPMGEIVQFVAEVKDDNGDVIDGAKVRWSSASWAATVTPTGEVEARAIGTTQIVAEADNGATARFEISVEDWKKPARRRRR